MRLTSWRSRISCSSPASGRGAAGLAVVVLLCAFLLTPGQVEAHAFLERSDPEANDIVAEVPDQVRLWFTEPLEVQYSHAELFDSSGQRIETEDSVVGPDPYQLSLRLPADLPNGTYSVQWRNVSTADGHPETGYVPFTIGSSADVVVPVPPAQVDFGGPSAVVNAIGRWLSLLGVAGVAGSIVTWFWVLRPSTGRLSGEQRARMASRVRLLGLASVVVAIAGSFAALAVQTSTVGSALSVEDTLGVINGTRFGALWWIRVVLLLALGAFLYLPYAWNERFAPARWLGVGLAAAVMLPFSLNSHAAAPGVGRAAAVVTDWIHLGASSVWVGGLLTLLIGVVYASRGVPRDDRRATYAAIIPRFSTLAIISVVILGVTGLYASWLQVGNLVALRETSYGQTLLFKVALMLGMVVLGAVNLLYVAPRMRKTARSSVHFGRTVAAEVVLGVLVLFMVGLLTSLPTARDTIAAESGRTVFHIEQAGTHVSLYVTPGAVGSNRYTADFSLPASAFPGGTQVMLRTTPANDLEGVREVHLLETEPGRYEASGSELSVVGGWDLELILRRPDMADWRVTTDINIQSAPPEARAPGPAPRFPGTDGAIWMLVLGSAVLVTVVGVRRPGGRGIAGFGVALLAISLVGLGFNHEQPVAGANARNPIEPTTASIERGAELFAANCVACHGLNGEGDGELLASVDSSNSDLTAPHLLDHTEGELHWWISKGIGGTLMPGFEEELADEDIWHLVNYVQYLHENARDR
jgi:copper transport protein